ncbi:MAG: UDP-N-acetylmuramoyl-L-alanine--D-glutamate ligase [Acidimicrobiia bacterium]
MSASRVLVVGLAATGEAVARHFAPDATVTVIDDNLDAEVLARRAAEVGAVLPPKDATPVELMAVQDLVVPSPGVPPAHPVLVAATNARVPIRSEIDLAAERLPAPLVAVTGTNGKTTVTTLIAAMLERAGRKTVAAGNIGRPLLDVADAGADLDVVVAEVSSFQLEFTTRFRPRIAVLLDVAPDHLDWHGSFTAYAAAKARVFAEQQSDDVLVANHDDPIVVELVAAASSSRHWYSTDPGTKAGYRIEGDKLVDGAGVALVKIADLAPRAPHDVANALAAAAAAQAAGASNEAIGAVLVDRPRAPHRLTPVATVRRVTYIDDSKATNPHATVSAVLGFDRVVLVAGGRNKGLDLRPLRDVVSRMTAVIAIGDAAAEVEKTFRGTVPVERATSMRDAVRAAARRARPGDVVLLSPACASFDWYADYAARGDDFAREVAALASEQAGVA